MERVQQYILESFCDLPLDKPFAPLLFQLKSLAHSLNPLPSQKLQSLCVWSFWFDDRGFLLTI